MSCKFWLALLDRAGDFYWHDALVRSIQVDRSNPGDNDSILFEIEWPDESQTVSFVFYKVYWANMNLNFGIKAEETILCVEVLEDNNEDLANFYSKWKGLMDDIKLYTYRIELNSTGGIIKIIATGFKIIKK